MTPLGIAILPARYERHDGVLVEVEPATPCPELLIESEAIRYLRLDLSGVKNPKESLARYRGMGLLRATQVGRRLCYRRLELDVFLEKLTNANPR